MERPITSLCYWGVVTPVIGVIQTPAEVSRDGVFFFMELLPKTKSNLQNCVTLSVTEAELVSATSCAQSLLFHYKLLTYLGLRVQMPMSLEIDNKDVLTSGELTSAFPAEQVDVSPSMK
jgi:hypothetical protein